MTADREVLRTRLIDAFVEAAWGTDDPPALEALKRRDVGAGLDAILALCSPCQTCGEGDGLVYPDGPESAEFCPDHRLSVPVVVEYLMEQVGWATDELAADQIGADRWFPYTLDERREARESPGLPVWVYKENAS